MEARKQIFSAKVADGRWSIRRRNEIMSDVETHRSISINVAKERLEIRTDLSDADLKEIVDYIDERYASYGKYNLEAGKRMAETIIKSWWDSC